METIVNGCRIYYETMGEGPALVILHGGPGLGDCRDQVRDYGILQDQYRLLFYDARGSGRSEEKGPYSHDQWCADLDELTRQVGIDKFALLGHSYGGIVAQEYALRHPERLTQLILVDTTPSTIENDETVARALAANLPGVEEEWLRRLFEGKVASNEEMRQMWWGILPLYFEGEFDPVAAEEATNQIYFHYQTHNYAFAVNQPAYDVRPKLGSLKVPTLIICGVNDWVTPLAKSEEIQSLIPGSELVVFHHSGHMPMVEESEKFIGTLRSFLAKTQVQA